MNRKWFEGIFLKCWLLKETPFLVPLQAEGPQLLERVSGAGTNVCQCKSLSQKDERVQWLFNICWTDEVKDHERSSNGTHHFLPCSYFAFRAIILSTRHNMSWPPNLLHRFAVWVPDPFQLLWKVIQRKVLPKQNKTKQPQKSPPRNRLVIRTQLSLHWQQLSHLLSQCTTVTEQHHTWLKSWPSLTDVFNSLSISNMF